MGKHAEKPWKELLKPADYVTMLNLLSGTASMMLSAAGNFIGAIIMMAASAAFDWLDGKVARLSSSQNVMGKELDSLADIVSFGVAPAMFGYFLIGTNLQMAASLLLVACGALRLARFNVTDFKGSFVGMPIPLSAIIASAYYIISYLSGVSLAFFPYLYIAMALLMISNIRFMKL